MRYPSLLCVLALAQGTFAQSDARPRPSERIAEAPIPKGAIELSFGVYTADKATVMYRRFTPMLEALESRMEKTLQRRVDLELRIFKTYAQAHDAFVGGRVDFVRFGPASYVLAKQKNPAIQLLAMESRGGGRTFPGYVVVRVESPIRKLSDLRGKKFAFGDATSTIGRYLVQEQLLKVGISAKELGDYEYLGRHDLVYRAVAIGDFDAGALKRSTFKKLNKGKKLRVIHELRNTTKPWVARAGLDRRVARELGRALRAIKTGPALAKLKIDGFLEAEDHHYQSIRRSMQRSAKFRPVAARPGR